MWQAVLDMSGWPRNWLRALAACLKNMLKLPEAAAEPMGLCRVSQRK